jgi:hypothetical protein
MSKGDLSFLVSNVAEINAINVSESVLLCKRNILLCSYKKYERADQLSNSQMNQVPLSNSPHLTLPFSYL